MDSNPLAVWCRCFSKSQGQALQLYGLGEEFHFCLRHIIDNEKRRVDGEEPEEMPSCQLQGK